MGIHTLNLAFTNVKLVCVTMMQGTADTYLLLESAGTELQTLRGLMHLEQADIQDLQQFQHLKIQQLE